VVWHALDEQAHPEGQLDGLRVGQPGPGDTLQSGPTAIDALIASQGTVADLQRRQQQEESLRSVEVDADIATG
jgi:hypothetical protein